MKRAPTVLPLLALLCTAAAPAGQRCLAAEYSPPESIREAMRSYVMCGLFVGRVSDLSVRLNGQSVFVNGLGAGGCGEVRQSAVEASEARLAGTMPDAEARRSFVLAEFDEADRFLTVAARSADLTIGEEASAPNCRISDAQNR